MAKELNLKLNKAKEKKDDEFYTRLEDIQIECIKSKDQFKDKIIYLNCDKVNFSNFYFYFKDKFREFELKKIILTSLGSNEKHEIFLENNYIKETSTFIENFNGDFKSHQSLEILKESDIVVTNPPFSLFRVFIATMIEYNKKFLVLGPMPALGNKDIYKAIYDEKVWVGYHNNSLKFLNKEKELKAVSICWYTNLEVEKLRPSLKLDKLYNEKDYLKYDNFDAIEVARLKDIPIDYNGLIGVPITILKRLNREKEIIGIDKENNKYIFDLIAIDRDYVKERFNLNNKKMFSRILIKLKRVEYKNE